MKIKLDKYRDLGKCTFATTMDEYDTERDHIYFQVKEIKNQIKNIKDFIDSYAEIKINNLDDLIRWLWCNPGISTRNRETGCKFYFSECKSWWYNEIKSQDRIDYLEKEKLSIIEEIKKNNE